MVEQPTTSPSATRAQRYRERQRAGALVVPLDVSASDVAGLVAYGLVEDLHVDDRAGIAKGIQALLFALSHGAIEIVAVRFEVAWRGRVRRCPA